MIVRVVTGLGMATLALVCLQLAWERRRPTGAVTGARRRRGPRGRSSVNPGRMRSVLRHQSPEEHLLNGMIVVVLSILAVVAVAKARDHDAAATEVLAREVTRPTLPPTHRTNPAAPHGSSTTTTTRPSSDAVEEQYLAAPAAPRSKGASGTGPATTSSTTQPAPGVTTTTSRADAPAPSTTTRPPPPSTTTTTRRFVPPTTTTTSTTSTTTTTVVPGA